MLPWVMYMVSASCDIFGSGLVRISEVFKVSVALESCGNADLTNSEDFLSVRDTGKLWLYRF
jgi:hypothetical protein